MRALALALLLGASTVSLDTRAEGLDLTGPAYWAGVCDGLMAAGIWVRSVRHDGVVTLCPGTDRPDAVIYEWGLFNG